MKEAPEILSPEYEVKIDGKSYDIEVYGDFGVRGVELTPQEDQNAFMRR